MSVGFQIVAICGTVHPLAETWTFAEGIPHFQAYLDLHPAQLASIVGTVLPCIRFLQHVENALMKRL